MVARVAGVSILLLLEVGIGGSWECCGFSNFGFRSASSGSSGSMFSFVSIKLVFTVPQGVIADWFFTTSFNGTYLTFVS